MPHNNIVNNAIIVPDESKVYKEELLLGSVELEVVDCEGNKVTVHGLTGNDLHITRADGTYVSILQAITEAGGGQVDLSTSTITTEDGKVMTIKQIADSLEGVPSYTVADATAQYKK